MVRSYEADSFFCCFFFFQAEDGIRDDLVTGVQTCALPISVPSAPRCHDGGRRAPWDRWGRAALHHSCASCAGRASRICPPLRPGGTTPPASSAPFSLPWPPNLPAPGPHNPVPGGRPAAAEEPHVVRGPFQE